jgi:hypothetical protein
MPAPTPAADLAAVLLAYLSLPSDRSGILRPRPSYLPHPHRRLPRLRGVMRVRVENAAYEDRPFSIPNDAPRRVPAPILGRPGAGFLRCPAAIATPYRFGPAPRSAAAGPATIATPTAGRARCTKPGPLSFAWGDGSFPFAIRH